MIGYKKILIILVLLAVGVGFATVAFIYWEKRSQNPISKKNENQIKLAADENGEPRLVVQLGHSRGISSAVYSPDGKYIVSGGVDDSVAILWEVATGREIRRFIGHQGSIKSVAFSPDSLFVLTGGGIIDEYVEGDVKKDFTSRLWDIKTGAEIKRFEGHTETINSVSFSPDGQYVLTASDDKTARLWEVKTQKEIRKLDFDMLVLSFTVAPSGHYITISNNKATVWDKSSWQEIGNLQAPNLSSVTFSPDGRYWLSSPSEPKTDNELMSEQLNWQIIQWDASTGKRIRDFKGFGPAVFSPDSRLIISAGGGAEGRGAQIWDSNTGAKLNYLSGFLTRNPANEVSEMGIIGGISFSPSENSVLISFHDPKYIWNNPFPDNSGIRSMYIYDTQTWQKKLTLEGKTIEPEIFYNDVITNVDTIIQIGPTILNKSTSQKVTLQKTNESTNFGSLRILSKDGSLVLMQQELFSGFDVWETKTGNKIGNFKANCHAAEISSNNKYILCEELTLDDEYIIILYTIKADLIALKWSNKIKVSTSMSNVRGIDQRETYSSLSPDGKFVYALSPETAENTYVDENDSSEPIQQSELLIIDVESGSILDRIKTPQQTGFQGICISPNGRYVGFGTSEGFSVFDTSSKLLLFNHLSVNAFAYGFFSPDSKSLAVYDTNSGSVKVWNMTTGKLIKDFSNFEEGIPRIVTFSPDSSKLLISFSGLSKIKFAQLFNISTGKEIYKFEHYDWVTGSAFSSDGRVIITSSTDGSNRFWSVETGKEICRFSSFQNGDWIVNTPDGRFDTNNLDKIEGMSWVIPSEPLRLLPIDIFLRQYYEPKLLARILKCNEENNCEQEFKPLPDLNTLNRSQPNVKIADIKPDSEGTVEVTVEVANIKSEGQVDTSGNPLESGVYDVRIFRDGQLVGYAPKTTDSKQSTWEWIRSWFVDSPKETNKVELDRDGKAILKFPKIKLPKTGIDKLEFSAYAFNADQIKSETSRKTYEFNPQIVKGRAYIISLGVNATSKDNLYLRFAANDARQTQENLSKRLFEQGQYEEVINIPLISDFNISVNGTNLAAQDASLSQVQTGSKIVTENTATKAHFKVVLDVLAGRQVNTELLKTIKNADKLRQANPEDLIIISVSSHGFADKDGIFYLVPSNSSMGSVESDEFRQKAISSDELSLWLRDVDGGELTLIIDACHSALAVESADFKPAPMNSRGLGQLSYDKGMQILTATQADNVALETNKTRQGLLSYALLQNGLNDFQADFKPQDKTITMSEWLNFGVERVPQLYEEARLGQTKLVRETVDSNETETQLKTREEKTQQPSLFDFSRGKKDITIDRRSGKNSTQISNVIEPTEKPITESTPQSIPEGFNGRVIKFQTVIVRASDTMDSEEVGKVYLNDPIKIGEQKGAWFRVTTKSGIKGWMHGNSLEFVKP